MRLSGTLRTLIKKGLAPVRDGGTPSLPVLRMLIVLGLVLGGAVSATAQDMDAKLADFFKQRLEESFRLRPLDATRLGDHRYDALMDNLYAAIALRSGRIRPAAHWRT